MKWNIQDHCIEELYLGEKNMIFPWGLETADSSAFFSLQKGVGYRYKILREHIEYTERNRRSCCVVKMMEGKWSLDTEDTIVSETQLRRRAHLTCLESSHFMDFVMRFRFRKEFFSKAFIEQRQLSHRNTNIYYQYPVNEVTLEGKKQRVSVKIEDFLCPSSLKPCMYVRDDREEWVVHARMVPQAWDKEVIKLCNSWAKTRPLPQAISNILLAIPWIKRNLWYRGERKPFRNFFMRRLNPQACPITKISQGGELIWQLTVNFD
ncbi:MAG: hypothetical protein Tsb0021_04980 [Chlamydiales bacterium]